MTANFNKKFNKEFNRVDKTLTTWMAAHGVTLLRISLGIIFLWFGALKFIPGASPAQSLATRTIEVLSFGVVGAEVSILLLATWESAIGLGLIFGIYLRATLFLLFLQMLGTLTPLVLFPTETFMLAPFSPTLEGQYIIKNLVLIASGIVIGATVRSK
ncbi:MAG: DoxX family membrane protein [Trueperaceae bacterium]